MLIQTLRDFKTPKPLLINIDRVMMMVISLTIIFKILIKLLLLLIIIKQNINKMSVINSNNNSNNNNFFIGEYRLQNLIINVDLRVCLINRINPIKMQLLQYNLTADLKTNQLLLNSKKTQQLIHLCYKLGSNSSSNYCNH